MTTDGPPLASLFGPTLVGYFVTTVVIALISAESVPPKSSMESPSGQHLAWALGR